ncbi:helix-turn-helix domain-containing protein [Mariniflexile sp. HNIBRBA6329]|uniref:helix-turn-helix domain-containing protein n=1 Tax=Mariniflexile sp. HNIBRBA6329 TaxID=3373088 RepID=UPI0037473C32
MSTNKKHRIQRINQMLLEMASGNFFYRLERSSKNDNLEAISISLNMLAEEIQETLLHQGYVNSNRPIMEIIQMSFVLDVEGCIEIVNQQACNILTVLHADIIGKPIDAFLEDHSKKAWIKTWNLLKQKDFQDLSLELKFISKSGLVIPKICYITTFKGEDANSRKTLISVIHHTTSQDDLEHDLKQRVIQFSSTEKQPSDDTQSNNQKQKIRLTFEDIHKIREGQKIIINNLEKDFPSLKDFALQLGTNEFKLKYGFKELYGTTVHRFLMEERLRKSKMMIQFTQQSLKSIAQMTGFKSIAHFSRTFKKRFGYTPSDLRKKSFEEDK